MNISTSTNNFKIQGRINSDGTSLIMQIPKSGHISTKTLPFTESILAKNLPSIFCCECFNDANKNFGEECKNTELGHLFEHIMLEHLCIEKLANGNSDAVYEGRTSWEEDKAGTFYIEIKINNSEIEIIKKAFHKSIELLEKILLV